MSKLWALKRQQNWWKIFNWIFYVASTYISEDAMAKCWSPVLVGDPWRHLSAIVTIVEHSMLVSNKWNRKGLKIQISYVKRTKKQNVELNYPSRAARCIQIAWAKWSKCVTIVCIIVDYCTEWSVGFFIRLGRTWWWSLQNVHEDGRRNFITAMNRWWGRCCYDWNFEADISFTCCVVLSFIADRILTHIAVILFCCCCLCYVHYYTANDSLAHTISSI